MSDTLLNARSTSAEIEEVQTEAKRTFNLKARLAGFKSRTTKVLVFTDPELVEKVAILNGRRAGAQGRAEALIPNDENKVAIASAKKDVKALDAEMEPLKEKMLESALAIHLVALPDIAIQASRRAARKASLQEDGTRDDEVHANVFKMELLKKSIVKIVDSSGAEAEDLDIEELHAALPYTQWERLQSQFDLLQFTDSVAQAATDDAGF